MSGHGVSVIDSHTAGEPTRVVVAGGPDLGTGDLASRVERFQREFDHFRSGIVCEPRGSEVIVGALLCEPLDPQSAAGVIFFNDVGYLGMCGHGTIGLVTTLAHMGRIGPGEHQIETPVGNVSVQLHEDGRVSFSNVSSYRLRAAVAVEVPGYGRFTGDIAWAGNWFFLIGDHQFDLSIANRAQLVEVTTAIRSALFASGITGEDGALIDHIELFSAPRSPKHSSRNFVLCPGASFDRSPCGTGTSAKLACLYADGKLAPGETWIQEGILGTFFEGTVTEQANGHIHPRITGQAWITAETKLLFQKDDPFPGRYRLLMKSFEVLIIGAGIVGCACARECAQAGLRVGLLEGHVFAGGATAAGMGHVVVMDDSPAQLALTHYSRSLWQELLPELPETTEYETRGTLWVAADDEEMAEVHAKLATYAAAGIRASALNATEIAAEEPHLRRGLAGGLLVPDDGVIYPPAAAGFFLEQARAHGATFLAGPRAISVANGVVKLADGTTLQADRIVLATGAECDLLPNMPIKKRKGHLLITDRYPDFVHHQLVELGYLKSAHKLQSDSVAFNIQPRRTGQLLIGSSRQYDNENPAADTKILGEMLERAQMYMPDLARLSGLRVWTGFRAATPDKLPLIGPAAGLSEDPTLWLAAGFEGLGITNSLAAGRLLTDQILARPTAIDVTPYLPQRVATEAQHA